jgi:hypothetical protein
MKVRDHENGLANALWTDIELIPSPLNENGELFTQKQKEGLDFKRILQATSVAVAEEVFSEAALKGLELSFLPSSMSGDSIK